MAINGTHMLFYTSEPEELRAMLRDAFGFKYVDAGGGWLIFALPPAEIGVHPSEGPNWDSGTRHEISFMCDDIHKTMLELRAKGVAMDAEFKTQRYGHTVMLQLPGGCKAMLYQPLHPVAAAIGTAKRAKTAKTAKAKRATKPVKRAAKAQPGRRAKKAARRR